MKSFLLLACLPVTESFGGSSFFLIVFYYVLFGMHASLFDIPRVRMCTGVFRYLCI